MIDRAELLESALESLKEGVALADPQGCVAFWNAAAEQITGYSRGEMVGHRVRETLNVLVIGGAQQWIRHTGSGTALSRGSMLHVRHKLGCEIPVMARVLNLRDALGADLGSGAVFHTAEKIIALPDTELSEDSNFAASRAELGDRLAALHEDCVRSGVPFGVLWISVDQASGLRRTHGGRAVESMLEKTERALGNGLRASDEIGRWGNEDYLVLSHERNPALLAAHGELLAGLARTTEFRWWGDRISITVSIGAAQAERGEPVATLLERAQAAMAERVRSGGNGVTKAQGNR